MVVLKTLIVMITNMHYGASKITFHFAEYLRNNMTPSEKMLWYQLSKSALGYRFRCQHPIWKYVVDFYCHPLKLVIEVDGTIHTLEDIKLNDLDRENNLKSIGLHLIRFTNDQVLDDIDLVVQQIKNEINNIKMKGSPLQGI